MINWNFPSTLFRLWSLWFILLNCFNSCAIAGCFGCTHWDFGSCRRGWWCYSLVRLSCKSWSLETSKMASHSLFFWGLQLLETICKALVSFYFLLFLLCSFFLRVRNLTSYSCISVVGCLATWGVDILYNVSEFSSLHPKWWLFSQPSDVRVLFLQNFCLRLCLFLVGWVLNCRCR